MDLDGDGRPEIVAGPFDGRTGRRRHLLLFDAATGATKGEALDMVPLATAPLLR